MDSGAQYAIEATIIGLCRAGVIPWDRLETVVGAIEDASRDAALSMPSEAEALKVMVGNIRHQIQQEGPS